MLDRHFRACDAFPKLQRNENFKVVSVADGKWLRLMLLWPTRRHLSLENNVDVDNGASPCPFAFFFAGHIQVFPVLIFFLRGCLDSFIILELPLLTIVMATSIQLSELRG